ncbi:BUD13 homolog [Telopea speciosissima]|uniref:BUD13 homolog n=1 Tax=Telopea speciosissima TaxID=54955 RepID=UPI001CC6E341|nr:BUD13 homolog [Telopea speciosissima]XP_043690219.1 BUD13 homolog [Telopea speciosissima]
MAASTSASTSLKEYLKKYQSSNEDEKKKKKRKKEKPKAASMGGILVVDEDPVWQKPLKLDEEEDEDDSADEAKPQVEEDIEVKRMKRLEQIRARRSYNAISEDGSGWVSISDAPKQSNFDKEKVDISPPRRLRARYDTPSPEPNQKPADSANESPELSRPWQRQQRQYDMPSPEPEQKPAGGDEVSDLSTPRRKWRRYDSSSPEPKLKPEVSGQEVSDLSPSRRQRRCYDSPSPEPKLKSDGSRQEVSDLSLPWRRQRRYDTPSVEAEPNPMKSEKPHRDLSPPRRSSSRTFSEYETKNSERSDLPDPSPQGIPNKNADLSPPRRSRKDPGKSESSDLSPPRRMHRGSLDNKSSRVSLEMGLSPPRKRRKDSERSESPDLSPPRRIHRHIPEVDASRASLVADLSPPRKSRKDSSSLKERPKAGLVSRQDFREETAKLREDSARFKQMDPSSGGPGAEPVYRDKLKGTRISKEEFLKAQKGEEKPKEKQLEWGKGLAQKREAEARQRELELEKDKPFARTRDDPEIDKMLKERVRWGDPMAHLVKRKLSEPVLEDLGDEEKMKESGFIIPQDIPSHSWIIRRIDAPRNRYDIRPGRHWDGVDRSNGTEKQYFKRMNEKHATEREAYLWSVSDM